MRCRGLSNAAGVGPSGSAPAKCTSIENVPLNPPNTGDFARAVEEALTAQRGARFPSEGTPQVERDSEEQNRALSRATSPSPPPRSHTG